MNYPIGFTSAECVSCKSTDLKYDILRYIRQHYDTVHGRA